MLTRKQALRRFRIAVSLFFFVNGIIFGSWANRIPDIKRAMQLNDAQLGNVLFAIPIGQMVAMAISAWMVNRYGSRRMLVLAALLYSLFLVPLGFAETPWALMCGLFLFGMNANLFNAAANTQGVDVEHLYARTIMSSFHGLWSMGGFLGGLISMGFIGLDIPPRIHFLLIFVVALIPISLIRRQLVHGDLKAPKPEADTAREKPKLTTFYKRIDPYVVGLGLMAFAAMMCEGCMYDWSGIYFMQVVDAPDKLTQLGYVVCMCTMTTGRFVADRFVTRFGARKVVCASGLLIFSGMMLSVLLPTLMFATIGFFLVGFGISSTVPICYSMAGRTQRMNSSIAISVVASIGYLGFLLGPPVIGHVSHAITLHYTFAVIACVGLLMAIGSRRLPQAE